MFLVTLDLRIVHLATNQTLSVEDSVFRVGVEGVLGSVADTVETNATSEAQPYGPTNRGTYSRSSSEKDTHEGVIR